MAHLYEKIIPLDEKRFLCLTYSPFASSEINRDMSVPYAFIGTLDSEETKDCINDFSIPNPPDLYKVERQKNDVIKWQSYLEDKPDDRYFNCQLAKSKHVLSLLTRDSRLMPYAIFDIDDGYIYQIGNAIFRINTALQLIGNYTLTENVKRLVGVSGDGKLGVFADDYLVLELNDEMKQVYSLDPRIEVINFHNPYMDFYDAYFFQWINGDWYQSHDSVLHRFDGSTGKKIESLAFASQVRNFDSASNQTALVSCSDDGAILEMDINGGSFRKLEALRGKGRYRYVKSRFDENWVAILNEDSGSLSIVNRRTSKTRNINLLKRVERKGETINKYYTSNHTLLPDMAFVGETLVTVKGGEITKWPLNQLEQDSNSWYVCEKGKPGYEKPYKYSKKLSYAENIDKSGIENGKDFLKSLYSQPLKINVQKPSKKRLPLGTSKLGGLPDLPQNRWPTSDGHPMFFLAQFNLEEIFSKNPSSRLPKQGLLSFFMGVDEQNCMPWPNESLEKGRNWKVIHTKKLDALTAHSLPKNTIDDFELPQCKLKLQQLGPRIPSPNSLPIASAKLSGKDFGIYNDFAVALNPSNQEDIPTQLEGFATPLQNEDLEICSELASRGIDIYSGWDDGSDISNEISQSAPNWTLLLQLASEDKSNMLWGDGGVLYWFIHRDDLEAGNFDRVWVQIQT